MVSVSAQVFFAVAVFLGEGMYHFFKIFAVSIASFLKHSAATRRGIPRTAMDVANIDVSPLPPGSAAIAPVSRAAS